MRAAELFMPDLHYGVVGIHHPILTVRSLRPKHGALLNNEQDVHLFERVVFMARAGR